MQAVFVVDSASLVTDSDTVVADSVLDLFFVPPRLFGRKKASSTIQELSRQVCGMQVAQPLSGMCTCMFLNSRT